MLWVKGRVQRELYFDHRDTYLEQQQTEKIETEGNIVLVQYMNFTDNTGKEGFPQINSANRKIANLQT